MSFQEIAPFLIAGVAGIYLIRWLIAGKAEILVGIPFDRTEQPIEFGLSILIAALVCLLSLYIGLSDF